MGCMAHELGHNLGAGHDTSSGDCASSKNHIMDPTIRFPKEERDHRNGYTFSTCSERDFVKTLSSKSCVKNGAEMDPKISTRKTLPGKKYDVDFQCKWMRGTDYRFNSNTQHCCYWAYEFCKKNPSKNVGGDECHAGLWCKRANGNCQGTSTVDVPADGTPCGSGKMCMNNRCQ